MAWLFTQSCADDVASKHDICNNIMHTVSEEGKGSQVGLLYARVTQQTAKGALKPHALPWTYSMCLNIFTYF